MRSVFSVLKLCILAYLSWVDLVVGLFIVSNFTTSVSCIQCLPDFFCIDDQFEEKTLTYSSISNYVVTIQYIHSETTTFASIYVFYFKRNRTISHQTCSLDSKANSAFHPSGGGKWVPASAGKAKACMVHSVSGCTRGVQVKLWDPLRTRTIPERLNRKVCSRQGAIQIHVYLTLLYL